MKSINKIFAALVLLSFWSVGYCDDPKPVPVPPTPKPSAVITAPKEVSGIGTKKDPYIFTSSTRCLLSLVGAAEGTKWDTADSPSDAVVIDGKYLSFSLFENGLYEVVAYGPDVYSKVWFSIKSGLDPPNPGPSPGPNPGPGPSPVPIPTSKLTVVVVKNGSILSKLSAAKLQALLSSRVRDYCDKHCNFGADGKTPEFKIYEKDTDVGRQSANIQKAFKTAVEDMTAAKTEEPWIAISNGTTGYSGPYPDDEASVLTLLKKYGGE